MYQSFNEILKDNVGSGAVLTENLDLVSPPPPAPQPGNNPPHIPQWGQSLTGRVGNLEKRVGNIEIKVGNIEQNMATKQDIAAVNQNITAINQRLDGIAQHLKSR